MNTRCCCRNSAAEKAARPSSALQRVRELAKWAGPGAVLFLMPKCPACVAAYVAVATGLGISFSAAAQLRLTILALCIACLAWMLARRAWLIAARTR